MVTQLHEVEFETRPIGPLVLTTPVLRRLGFREGSCWIPGSYTPCAGLKHLILNGFFQRCHIGHDPRVKPVKNNLLWEILTNYDPGIQYEPPRDSESLLSDR